MESANLQKYESQNPILRRLIARFQERCIGVLEPLQIDDVLEVGCGEGFFLHELHQRFPRWRIKGSDISAEALVYARRMVPEAEFAVENLNCLSEADAGFDLVIASEVLEHLDDPARALSEIVRVSRRYMLLSVPNEPWFQATNFLRGKYVKRLGNHPEHVQRWSKRRFVRFVAAQCRVLLVVPCFPWTILLAEKHPGT